MKKIVSLFVVIVFFSIIVFATPQEARADVESAQNTSYTLMVVAIGLVVGSLVIGIISKSKNNQEQAEVFEKEGSLLVASDYHSGNLNMNSSQLISEDLPEKKVERLISYSYNF